MKAGQTGTFFSPGAPFKLGEFIKCRVLEIRGERLLVELEDGYRGEIPVAEFAPQYFVTSNAKLTGLAPGNDEQ